MNFQLTLLFSAAAFAASSAAPAQTVLNTDLPQVNGTQGGGTAVTKTNASGTTTTVSGPSGGANRVSASPSIGSWYQSNIGGGGTVGITKTYSNDGNGAAYFSTLDGGSKSDLRYNFATPVALSSLTSLSFDFYRDASSAAPGSGTVFVPAMRLDIRKDGAFAGSLILEYKYQNQLDAPTGAWTNLGADPTNGIFWATRSNLGPTFASAAGGQKTLADWISGNAGSSLTVFGVSIGVGSGWNQFNGAVDHVAYSFAGGPAANFDFAVGVPEPASWMLMISGFGLVGGAARRRRRTALAA